MRLEVACSWNLRMVLGYSPIGFEDLPQIFTTPQIVFRFGAHENSAVTHTIPILLWGILDSSCPFLHWRRVGTRSLGWQSWRNIVWQCVTYLDILLYWSINKQYIYNVYIMCISISIYIYMSMYIYIYNPEICITYISNAVFFFF